MDGHRDRSLTDSQLDREIESALGIEPSPEFLARVRTRIASEPEPGRWRLDVASAFRRTSIEPLWGVGIVGIVFAVIVPQLMRDEVVHRPVGVAQVAEVAPPDTAPLPAQTPVTVTRIRQRAATVERSEFPRTVPLQLSPVLVSEDERRAFEFFVAAANAGRVPAEVIGWVPIDTQKVAALSPIEPLVIDPLPSLARIAQEEKGQWE